MEKKLKEKKARLKVAISLPITDAPPGNVTPLAVDKEELRKTIPKYKEYLLEIARQPLNTRKPTKQYQRHQAFLQWSAHDQRKRERHNSCFGVALLESEQRDQILSITNDMFVTKIIDGKEVSMLPQGKQQSPYYIASVLGFEAITRFIMEKKHCTYEQATGLGWLSKTPMQTPYADYWDKIVTSRL